MADDGDRKDPLTSFLFGLKIEALGLDFKNGTAFFKSVSGLSVETEVTDQVQGGNTAFIHKLVGGRKFKNLILKNGFTADDKLWNWRYAPFRVDGKIYQLGANLKPVCYWAFKAGYPVKWDGPELDASKSDLAIETIEIAHHGIEMFIAHDGPEG